MKYFALFAAAIACLLTGCSQTEENTPQSSAATDTNSTEATLEKGAKTAARVVVGQVVGTPAKVAMAATSAAEFVEKKVAGNSSSPAAAPATAPQ